MSECCDWILHEMGWLTDQTTDAYCHLILVCFSGLDLETD